MIEQTDWSAHVVVKVYIVLLWTPRFVICTVAVKTNISSSLIMNFALGLYNFKHYLRESLGHYFKYRREKPQWLKVWIFSTASLGMSHIDHGTSVFLFLFNLPTLSIYIFKEIYWLKTKLLKKFKFLSLGLSSYLHSYKNATIKEMFWKRVYMFNSSCLWGDWVERFLNIVMEIEVIFLFFLSKIGYFIDLHFKCYPFFWFPLQKPCISSSPLLLWGCSPTCPPTPAYPSWHSPILGHGASPGPRSSPPIDVQQGHPLLHMRLESWKLPCVLFVGCWMLKEFSQIKFFNSLPNLSLPLL